MILFGAPVNTHLWHTLLCATHMSLLGVLPLFYTHGVDSRAWREIAGACLPFDEVWGALVGTILGAWLGAVGSGKDRLGGMILSADGAADSYTFGLGPRVAEMARHDNYWSLCWMVCIRICRRIPTKGQED